METIKIGEVSVEINGEENENAVYTYGNHIAYGYYYGPNDRAICHAPTQQDITAITDAMAVTPAKLKSKGPERAEAKNVRNKN